MNVNNEFMVGVPIEQAWKAMLDLERIAPCLPGASIADQDGNSYKGTMRVKVGPITAKYRGTVSTKTWTSGRDERRCTPRGTTPADRVRPPRRSLRNSRRPATERRSSSRRT